MFHVEHVKWRHYVDGKYVGSFDGPSAQEMWEGMAKMPKPDVMPCSASFYAAFTRALEGVVMEMSPEGNAPALWRLLHDAGTD